jgi:hypothetical protein
MTGVRVELIKVLMKEYWKNIKRDFLAIKQQTF